MTCFHYSFCLKNSILPFQNVSLRKVYRVSSLSFDYSLISPLSILNFPTTNCVCFFDLLYLWTYVGTFLTFLPLHVENIWIKRKVRGTRQVLLETVCPPEYYGKDEGKGIVIYNWTFYNAMLSKWCSLSLPRWLVANFLGPRGPQVLPQARPSARPLKI